jgi:hypothetical protein
MQQVHQWLVKSGRLAISSDADRICVEVDPEGAGACSLTAQDAREVVQILTVHARALWESAAPQSPYIQSLQALSESAYRWQTESGVLTVLKPAEVAEIAISFEGTSPCRLTVGEAVEVIQIIEHLLKSPLPAE